MARHDRFVMFVRRKPLVPEVSTMTEPNGSSSLSVRLVTGVLLVIASGLACASHSVLVPPRLNLVPYGQIGLVTFTAENAKGSLHELDTRAFSDNILAAQTGIEVMELGGADPGPGRDTAT